MQSVSTPITVTIDGVNVSRGADQAILYTAAYGASTATNEYGYEITVENGVITQLGGNDSSIPQNGFVLSLHGTTMTALRTQITKAMTVQIDPALQTAVFSYDINGLQRAVDHAVDSAERQIERAKAAFVFADYDRAHAQAEEIRQERKTLFDGQDLSDAVQRSPALIDAADALCRTLCDSYPVQYRGVWIRPSQHTADEVEAYVKTLHEAHINAVSIEGWFDNGTVMALPENCLFSRHPQFQYDVLDAYVKACHKYGMECHLWMPILCVGSFHDAGNEHTPAGRKPEWMSLSNHGTPRNPNGFMMLDPANREVCDYLVDFYRYLVTTYDLDGFELDYIRYYAASADDDYGYTEAAFAGFEKAYGYGVTPEYDPNAVYWEDWCRFRRDCITALVRRIRAMIDETAPHVLLAADVAFPFEHALHNVYQNFPQWLEEGLLDLLHPMAYGDGYGEAIKESVRLAGDRCMVVTGLGAQGDLLRTEELERQTRENASYGAYGEYFFEAAAYFYKHLPPALESAAYRRRAIAPFADVSAAVRTALAYMAERIDTVIVPLDGLREGEATAVKSAIADAVDSVQNRQPLFTAFAALHRAINTVQNDAARRVLTKDLYRAEHLVFVKRGLYSPLS